MRALVLELVQGDTLNDRIAHGPLPIDDTLTIARQIAQALEAAHEKGVVHRDLKPANIKITPDGVVKVLDFGLARIISATDGRTSDSRSPTITIEGTREGLVMGTAAYMSPEQARGQSVDKRTDIWAFACVLYELLTARPAFAAETVSDTIAALPEREPNWSALPAATPASIHRLLRRCLRKDVKGRLRDISDAQIEIEDAVSGTTTVEPSRNDATRRREWVPWSVAGALAVALLAVAPYLVRTSGVERCGAGILAHGAADDRSRPGDGSGDFAGWEVGGIPVEREWHL